MRKKLLWIGDAVCDSGFGRVTHSLCDRFQDRYEVVVVGLNYYGGSHNYRYKIIPTSNNITPTWLKEVLAAEKPDLVCVNNDPWIARNFITSLLSLPENVPTFLYTPVDAPNLKKAWVDPLDLFTQVITYTKFGRNELLRSALRHDPLTIPHGFDGKFFFPRSDAREELGIDKDWFIVGMVARNQPRKRHDILIRAFSRWVYEHDKFPEVKLYLHCALNDAGWDIPQLAQFYGISDRLITADPGMKENKGVSVERLNLIYNSMDIHCCTSMGEGWNLPVMESMACAVPQIVPDYAALAEWPGNSVIHVPVTSFYHHTSGLNTVGGIVDETLMVQTLELLHLDDPRRRLMGRKAQEKALEPQFSWDHVAARFVDAFEGDYSLNFQRVNELKKYLKKGPDGL